MFHSSYILEEKGLLQIYCLRGSISEKKNLQISNYVNNLFFIYIFLASKRSLRHFTKYQYNVRGNNLIIFEIN